MLILVVYYICELKGFQFPDEYITGQYTAEFQFIVVFQMLGFLALMAYISETNRKKLQNKLDISRRQLAESEKMASLGQLTAGIAHEINNPIGFVRSSSEALKMDIEELKPILEKLAGPNRENLNDALNELQKIDPAFLLNEIETMINGIQKGSDRIEQIVDSLCIFSHQSEKAMQFDDINQNLKATLTILSNKLKKKNISVETTFGQLPPVPCFSGKISQVFINIIGNAIDVMNNNGELKIETYNDENWVFIKIADNGKGMSEQTKKHIFDPFFTTKGMGLGLSISYGIIEQHKGEIKVESAVGAGAEFIILLPLK